MKLKQWLYGAAALAMLAACSDKDIAPGSSDDENGGLGDANGISYLGISLELPSELETRAGNGDEGDQGNDNFDDGLKQEYNVNNAALLLFVGDTEADAEFYGAYKLVPDEAFDQPNEDNITVSFQKAARVKNPDGIKATSQLWGMALVNYDTDHFNIETSIENAGYGNLTIRSAETDDEGKLKLDANGNITVVSTIVTRKQTGVDGMKFGNLCNLITDCNFRKVDSDGNLIRIFMTNAPLSSKPGTSASSLSSPTIQTLTKLDKGALEDTEIKALQNPAGCIFVERALAKITCSSFPTEVTLKHTQVTNSDTGVAGYEDEDLKLTVESVSWALDNEEKNSYIVRNVSGLDAVWTLNTPNLYGHNRYRFIGGVGMNDHTYDPGSDHEAATEGKTISTWYRTYWCVDPAYADNKVYNDQANTPANFKTCNSSSVLYSHENTFNVANQNYKNTTRVVFKVKYKLQSNANAKLYAIRGQLRSFYLESDAQHLLMRSVLGSSTLHDLIVSLMKTGESKIDYKAEDFTVSYGIAENDNADKTILKGDFIIKNISLNSTLTEKLDMTKQTSEYVAAELAEVAEIANKANSIVQFEDNTCYYAAYVQHFGKTYCPLSDEVTPAVDWKGDRTDKVYGTNDAATTKYLGRYGLVRNNWYDLKVSDIGNLGKATVPDGNAETSDDNNVEEWYISARVHVLSWAKRTQGVTF